MTSAVRSVRPWCGTSGNAVGQVAPLEPVGGAVEIVLARQLEAERLGRRLLALAQHDRMMVALLDRPQIERVRLLGADQIAQAIDVKGAGAGEVAHGQFHVAGAHDVERRAEDGLADGHCGFYGGLRRPIVPRANQPARSVAWEPSCILPPTTSAAGRASASCPAMASSICARGSRRG